MKYLIPSILLLTSCAAPHKPQAPPKMQTEVCHVVNSVIASFPDLSNIIDGSSYYLEEGTQISEMNGANISIPGMKCFVLVPEKAFLCEGKENSCDKQLIFFDNLQKELTQCLGTWKSVKYSSVNYKGLLVQSQFYEQKNLPIKNNRTMNVVISLSRALPSSSNDPACQKGVRFGLGESTIEDMLK